MSHLSHEMRHDGRADSHSSTALVPPERSVTAGRAVTPTALVVKRGPNAGSRFLLDQAVTTAGRHPTSDIFLDDITVSRRHAQFRCVSGEFKVVDADSLNGTYVNREPVDSAVLTNGDEVQIGKFRLVFLTVPTTGDSESVTGDPVTSTSTKPEIGSSPTRYLDQHQANVANTGTTATT
jgi:pSer/pThr/pTyr-binding forkhead associated (FHA) protein